jgi:hypothetical protein
MYKNRIKIYEDKNFIKNKDYIDYYTQHYKYRKLTSKRRKINNMVFGICILKKQPHNEKK